MTEDYSDADRLDLAGFLAAEFDVNKLRELAIAAETDVEVDLFAAAVAIAENQRIADMRALETALALSDALDARGTPAGPAREQLGPGLDLGLI